MLLQKLPEKLDLLFLNREIHVQVKVFLIHLLEIGDDITQGTDAFGFQGQ